MTVKSTQTEPTDMFASVDNLYLQTLNYSDIDSIRHEILPFLEIAAFKTNSGRFTAHDILKSITGDKQQIWLARDNITDTIVMVCLTEIRTYPQKKALHISYVIGSNNERWMWVLGLMESWAKDIGCSLVEAEGREGWKPIVAPLGYKIEKVVYKKDLV